MLSVSMYDIIQNNFQKYGLSKIVICVYFYGPIKKKMLQNTFFFHIFIEKSVCHDSVWYDKDLERIYQN